MRETIRIEQALFGYQDGHHLVTSSLVLAPRVRQFLANVTDGSGPDSDEGFDGACTGLPVPETNYYALFCTWAAPEMPRPGCVWSHVLLLRLSDLGQDVDFADLKTLFSRPGVPPDVMGYEIALSWEARPAAGLATRNDEEKATALIRALYGQPESGVVILDVAARPWEATIFAVWSQQWSKMRCRFAFSSGSLADRRVHGVAFDVQIAPVSSQRLWGRGGPPTVVLEWHSENPIDSSARWLKCALDDLRAGSEGPLRRFLALYGNDVEMPRAAFPRLVECFAGPIEAEEDDATATLAQLATAFPEPSEALRLKRERLLSLAAYGDNLQGAWVLPRRLGECSGVLIDPDR